MEFEDHIQLESDLRNSLEETIGRLIGISKVTVFARITSGRSRAQVLIVDVTPENVEGPTGLHILKFGDRSDIRKELNGYNTARETVMRQYMPVLVAYTPPEKLYQNAVILYSLAYGTLHEATSLLNLVNQRASYARKQISALADIFLELFHSYTVKSTSPFEIIQDELGSLLKGGKSILRVAEENLYLRPDHELIRYEGDIRIWPNPIAYIQRKELWEAARALAWPTLCAHGDLHTENIVCLRDGSHSKPPTLIDFANFRKETSLFYDILYLEMALLLHTLPPSTQLHRENWLELGELLDQHVLLGSDRLGDSNVLGTCMLLEPLRKLAADFIENSGRREDFESIFWLTGVVIALGYFRKLSDSPILQKLALLVAARRLATLLNRLDISFRRHQAISDLRWLLDDSMEPQQGGITQEEPEEQFVQALRILTKLKRVLSQKIGESLSSCFGTQWSRHIPDHIREDAEKKMQIAFEVQSDFEYQRNLLDFADFNYLIEIIDNFWGDVFHSWFLNKQITIEHLREIGNYESLLMKGFLLPKQYPIFTNLCRRFVEQLESLPPELPLISSADKLGPAASSNQSAQKPIPEDQTAFHQKISILLGEMTGLFEGERDALLDYIEHNLNLCSPILLEEIRHKFVSLPNTESKIQTLVNRLPPERPKSPNPQWKFDVTKWLSWAASSYLPYRYWMMINEQADDEIKAMSLIYEDWLYNSYTQLIKKVPESFVCGSYKHIIRLLEQNKIILWILVDNLPFFSQSTLVKQLDTNGFRVTEAIRQVAMLPSETFASRNSALVGRLPNQIPQNTSEIDALKKAWQSHIDKRVVVLENPNELDRIDQYQAELFIYIYSRLDNLWHTPTSKDFEREEEVEVALAKLVARLYTAMTKLEQRDPALLVISTDHGSTYLHHQSEKLQVPPAVTRDPVYEKHHRFIRTSRPDVLNKIEWFYLDKDEFYLHHSYAVARGWRYIDNLPPGFTHGGLTPEETIVPLLVCELGESEFERLQPIYEQATEPLRLGRPGKLSIRVRNPYRISIESLQISLSEYGLIFPPINVEPQMEAVTETVELQLPAKLPVEQDTVPINITARFIAGGQPRSHVTTFRIKVDKLFKTNLDDDFGAMFS